MGSEEACQALLKQLYDLNISYQMVDHPAADTTEEADAYISSKGGVATKTMFLKDKHKRFYVLVMDDNKCLDFKEFQELTGAKRVSMAKGRRHHGPARSGPRDHLPLWPG